MSNGKLSIDHRYRGRALIFVRALTADEAGWLMQREEVRQRLGEDLAIEFERETIRRAGLCPDCGKNLTTVVGLGGAEGPKIVDQHVCEPETKV